MTLKGQISLCLAAFFLALAGQIFLSFYQSGTVLRELDDQMGNFNAISRFQNGVERSLSAMEDYRWEYGDAKALTEELHSAFSVTNAWLWRIESDLGTVSEEQYLLYNAVSTTYDSYTALVDQLEEAVAAGQDTKAAQLYYNKIVPCGGYLRQYTQQLLNTAITDAQGTYTTVSALSDRVKWVQTVVVALCLALGCVMAFSVLTLLTPVQQMIGASREVTRGEFDSPDLPAPRQPEMAQLTEAFNHMKHSMAEQVTTLREKNEMERELHRQKTEALELQNRMERSRLQQLRSQIDPHFLFNTLNVILQTAGQEKAYRNSGPHHGSVAPAALQPDEQRRAGAAGPGSAHRGRVLLHLSRPLRRPGEDGVAHLRLPRFDGDDGAVLHLAAHRGECLQARHLAQGRGRRGAYPHQPAAG